MSVEDETERIGCLVDKCENLMAAGKMPIPLHIQAQALNESIEVMRDELKDIFFNLGGDKDTWD